MHMKQEERERRALEKAQPLHRPLNNPTLLPRHLPNDYSYNSFLWISSFLSHLLPGSWALLGRQDEQEGRKCPISFFPKQPRLQSLPYCLRRKHSPERVSQVPRVTQEQGTRGTRGLPRTLSCQNSRLFPFLGWPTPHPSFCGSAYLSLS